MPNHAPEQKIFTILGGKFKFSAQGHDLTPFVGNGTKFKITSEIKPPLVDPPETHSGKKQKLIFYSLIWLLHH